MDPKGKGNSRLPVGTYRYLVPGTGTRYPLHTRIQKQRLVSTCCMSHTWQYTWKYARARNVPKGGKEMANGPMTKHRRPHYRFLSWSTCIARTTRWWVDNRLLSCQYALTMVAIWLTIQSFFPSGRDGADGERGELKVALQLQRNRREMSSPSFSIAVGALPLHLQQKNAELSRTVFK
jgi:hypothetical protein